MNDDVLEHMLREYLTQSAVEYSISWQGGEPTLMGLQFFEKAVDLEMKYGSGKTIGNGLQTNGLNIDSAWAKFLREYRFLVGLSIDGPMHVHNHYRRTHVGGGTYSRVSAAARSLLDEGVAVNALTVVNDYSAGFTDEIYEHHRDMGLNYMQFIPCVETDPMHSERAAPFSVTAEAYGAFLCRLYDRWRADFRDGMPSTSVRIFESLLFGYAGFPPPECTLLDTCGNYLVVEHNGDIYTCDFFVEEAWKLGNVMGNGLISNFISDRQRSFGELKAMLPRKCIACQWVERCRGGCPKDRVRDPMDRGVSHFCDAYKMLFEHADADLKFLADNWKKKDEEGRERRAKVSLAGNAGRNDPCPCGSGQKYKKCCGR